VKEGAGVLVPKFQTRAKLEIPFPLGKLGIKEEPGKVRVFAMVDW
jgi:hypothetical protein